MNEHRYSTCPVCDGYHTADLYDSHDVRGLPCQWSGCGKTIHYPVTYQGLGCFCSWPCVNAALAHVAQSKKASA